MEKETRIIGYWKEIPWRRYTKEEESNLPWPEADSLTSYEEKDRIIKFLKDVEKKAEEKEIETMHYRGWSNCRLCEKPNGSREYVVETPTMRIHIPQGFIHYVEDHNVRPEQWFIDFILEN